MAVEIVEKGDVPRAVSSSPHGAAVTEERLQQLEQLSRWLDHSIQVPGTNFYIGWDTIIGLIPGVGDVVTALFSAWIIEQARQMGVSKFTLARMIANTGIDSVVGMVPLLGDFFDATFKSNRKNLELLKKHLRKQGVKVPDVK